MKSIMTAVVLFTAALFLMVSVSDTAFASRHGKPGTGTKKNVGTQTEKATKPDAKGSTSKKKGKKKFSKNRPKKPKGAPSAKQKAENDKLQKTQKAKLANSKLSETAAKHRAVDMTNLGFNKSVSGAPVAAPIDAVRGAVQKADRVEARTKVKKRIRRQARSFKAGAYKEGEQG
ncbi:MAG: hypothetical protein MI743_12425 [Sneathiellales bacterium]|nr:hypothetical protein [Sneathiellales bacterium]